MNMAEYNVEDFLKESVEPVIATKQVSIERFKTPFEIQTISEKENADLRKLASKRTRVNNQTVTETDSDKYVALLVAKSTIVPRFDDAQLQESYGTIGDAGATAKVMLRSGEFSKLAQAISEFNGFDSDEDLVDDAKN